MDEKFKQQLDFLVEVDKLKTIYRQTLLIDQSRRENDAEHSWHFALMAMVLYEYADQTKVNLARVLKMALLHDVVEIYAGDTFAFNEQDAVGAAEREKAAADVLFGLLPREQGREMKQLWQEFEQMETADAQFASAMDRLQPFINDYMTKGHTWGIGNVTSDKVRSRMSVVKEAAPELWGFVEYVIESSVDMGYLRR